MGTLKGFNSCTVMRCKKITITIMSMRTGEHSPETTDTVVEPCGVPLFSDAERANGKCRACAAGWTHPNNYPVDMDAKS